MLNGLLNKMLLRSGTCYDNEEMVITITVTIEPIKYNDSKEVQSFFIFWAE